MLTARACNTEWIYNGCMVEVKWESDWWHAKVKKVREPSGGGGWWWMCVCARVCARVRACVLTDAWCGIAR